VYQPARWVATETARQPMPADSMERCLMIRDRWIGTLLPHIASSALELFLQCWATRSDSLAQGALLMRQQPPQRALLVRPADAYTRR